MEPRPKAKMPPSQLLPIVRAVVFTALCDWDGELVGYRDRGYIEATANFIADRLCETLEQDHWDDSDRVRRAMTKLTWGVDTDG